MTEQQTKFVLTFVAGFVIGFLLWVAVDISPYDRNTGLLKSDIAIFEKPEEIVLFEKPREIVPGTQFIVSQKIGTIKNDFALAYDEMISYINDKEHRIRYGDVVLFMSNDYERLYDDKLITVDSSKVLREVGAFKYYLPDGSQNVVPIVKIMDK